MLSAIYNGRILIINKDAKIIKDTYDIDVGKYALSEEVIQCFEGRVRQIMMIKCLYRDDKSNHQDGFQYNRRCNASQYLYQ